MDVICGSPPPSSKSRPGSTSLMRQLSFEFLPEHSIVEISIDELKKEMANSTSSSKPKAPVKRSQLVSSKAPKRWVDAQGPDLVAQLKVSIPLQCLQSKFVSAIHAVWSGL